MELIVMRKNVYGIDLIYPVNETAIIFANLIGKKTFGANDLDLISALKYKIIFKNN
jgi:hypothetical protein